MKINLIYATAYVLIISLCSCTQSSKESNDSNINHVNSDLPLETETFSIDGEDIPLRVGPGKNFEKLVNQKATKALKEIHYAQVDYTCKVIIEETKDEWSKIRVSEPEWLSNTHIGWIPTKYIVNTKAKVLLSLDPNTYEILKTNHKPKVENFYVYLKISNFNKETLRDFTDAFRKEHCTIYCNVNVYDSKIVTDLVDKYPLGKKEYLLVADHFLAMSAGDAPEIKSWYPFQDSKYNEYGGKNWKKDPIE